MVSSFIAHFPDHAISAPSVFVATLGSQPQIITLALDELLARGHPLTDLIVVHLAQTAPKYHAAIQRLTSCFTNDSYAGRPLRFRMLPIVIGRQPVADLHSEALVDAASMAISQLVQQLKEQGATIHFCATGGRRLLSVLATAAALQYFDQHDRFWHLYSSDTVRAQTNHGAQMHQNGEAEVRLLRVSLPIIGPFRTAAPQPVPAPSTSNLDTDRCREVLKQLSARQREVLRAIACGLTPQEVAAELSIEVSTYYTHQKAIFEVCINAWELPLEQRTNSRWLYERFAPLITNEDW